MKKVVLPPIRFFVAWFSFGVCVSTGITCLFYLFGIGKTSDLSSTALQHINYSSPNGASSRNRSEKSTVTFALPADCPNFAAVISSIAGIRNSEAALRSSLYSAGVHWATAWSQQSLGLPVYILCLSFAFVALITSVINCIWPPSEEMNAPAEKFKVRKIRMRLPQKNQRWSGYIYTHLLDEARGPTADQRTDCVKDGRGRSSSGGPRRPENETLFD